MFVVIIDNTHMYYDICKWLENSLIGTVCHDYDRQSNYLINFHSIRISFGLEEDFVLFKLAWGEFIKKEYIDDS